MNEKITISVAEACKIIGVSKGIMLEMVRIEGFPCIRLRKKIIINKEKFFEWFHENSDSKRIIL